VTPIAPGARIGILGGGQLGRMTALAAARLGYACHVLAPEAESPAGQVAERWIRADYEDALALDALAAACAVVTLEFENVPTGALRQLAQRVPVRPAAKVLAITQDRLAEKRFLADHGIALATFHELTHGPEDAAALEALGGRGVLKTTRLGYDGRGQALVGDAAMLAEAARRLGPGPLVLEAFVDFAFELSVIVARGPDGTTVAYPPVRNIHRDHILHRTIHPAPLSAAQTEEAVAIATRIAILLELEGLLAVEMFLTSDGRLLVNELAPRPHNSGHWTIEGCAVSQFEQLVRAVCGLPLGPPLPLGPAEMTNLIGAEAEDWPRLLREPGARLHLYGKSEARPGRKMGHVTRLGDAG
jgi:5-(carboxyamino)imidazole ribonucleotide synthase